MHRLNELASKLTPAEVKEVEDFAEFLASRSSLLQSSQKSTVSFDGWAGCLAHVDLSAVELADLAAEIRISDALKDL